MFAHCLLPALLLLAVVDISAAQEYKSTQFKGRTDIPLDVKSKLSIPITQCNGEINPIAAYAKCKNGGRIAAVQVTVWDSKPIKKIDISEDLESATIYRGEPCDQSDAPVDLLVGCVGGSPKRPNQLAYLRR